MLHWKQVASAFGHTQNFEQKEGIGYKRLRNDLIVELEFGSVTNEHRARIVDKKWAKYRAKQPKCLRMLNTLTMEWITKEITHFWDKTSFAIYEPGKEVFYNTPWDTRINVICGSGIHYFLTLEAAYCYDMFRTAIFLREGPCHVDIDGNGGRCCVSDGLVSISISLEELHLQ
jgi:hypothetical protein